MKRSVIAMSLVLLSGAAMAQSKGKVPVKKKVIATTSPAVLQMKTALDSASYSFGSAMASNFKGNGLTALNYDLLVKGLKDAFADKTPLLSREVAQEAINKIFIQAGQQKYQGKISEEKLFLENNKKVEGVKTTASGLQYMVMKAGNGKKPAVTDTVLVNYKGMTLKGQVFDTNEGREPIELPLNRVIPGWTEALQLMPEGSKYRLFIPYQLAYGERGAGENIPPYSALIFEVELVKIK